MSETSRGVESTMTEASAHAAALHCVVKALVSALGADERAAVIAAAHIEAASPQPLNLPPDQEAAFRARIGAYIANMTDAVTAAPSIAGGER